LFSQKRASSSPVHPTGAASSNTSWVTAAAEYDGMARLPNIPASHIIQNSLRKIKVKYPVIESVGPPPELHAQRIAGEMAVWLIKHGEKRWEEMARVVKTCKDGNPISQMRLAHRLAAAAGPAIFDLSVKTGKRGRYTMYFHCWTGWVNGEPVKDGAVLPERPWLGVGWLTIKNKGNYTADFDDFTWLLINHHAMARLAERCGARTPIQLLKALRPLSKAAMDHITAQMKAHPENKLDIPPEGWRIPFQGGVAVIAKDTEGVNPSGLPLCITVLPP
jgi:hypothetical protein